jgi:DNA-binding MarR family transcriptional regulator
VTAGATTAGTIVGGHEPGLMAGVLRLHLLVSSQLEAVTAPHGIPLADYLVLGVIRRSPGGATSPGRICDVLHRTSGGMTLTLDRLEAAGWLVRGPDASDRRKVSVSLTPRGERLALAVNRSLHEWEDTLGLGARRSREVIAVVDEIADVLEHADGAPGA